ncbi:hypothetical protein [Vibrio sp. 10N.261.55.A7]|uniref:hypothetical protein n=1 Tax=Vibrio sp. 10N.261.55.A7 TaxID=1880851 RepID=UPI000C82D8B4|nr:hypothetical protein [Vibrio sp. 10N.261.55.A7]PMJ97869.1 hypothetical protein BCU12_22005 [Vibrio sp. 10N.261.55.A7]
MRKFHIYGLDVEVGNKTYTTRYRLIALLLALLFLLTNSGQAGYIEALFVAPPFILLLHEIYRLVNKPTILVVGYNGIYHHKLGLIPWSNIEQVEFHRSMTTLFVKSLIVFIKEPQVSYNYWFIKPIKMENKRIYISMSFTDCDVESACQHAKVMKSWYEATNGNAS